MLLRDPLQIRRRTHQQSHARSRQLSGLRRGWYRREQSNHPASGKRGANDIDKEMQKVKEPLVGDLLILKESLSLLTLLWIFLGVGSAYKIRPCEKAMLGKRPSGSDVP